MEESVYVITSFSLQIRHSFASYPPKDALASSYSIRLQKNNIQKIFRDHGVIFTIQ